MVATRVYTILILLALGALAGVLFVHPRHDITTLPQYSIGDVLIVSGREIPITIAATEQERSQGLSNTASLAKGTGKLFVFDAPGTYGFWMKDMRYSLDVVWIDENLHVIDVTSNVSPDTYPQVLYPPSMVQYVLEVNATDAAALGLTEGTVLTKKENL